MSDADRTYTNVSVCLFYAGCLMIVAAIGLLEGWAAALLSLGVLLCLLAVAVFAWKK